jgi:hypothetical protein
MKLELKSRRGPRQKVNASRPGRDTGKRESCLLGGELRENATARSAQVQHHQRADPIPAKWSPAAGAAGDHITLAAKGQRQHPESFELVVVNSSGPGDNRQLRPRLYCSCCSRFSYVPADARHSRPASARGRRRASHSPAPQCRGHWPLQVCPDDVSPSPGEVAGPPARQADGPLGRGSARQRRCRSAAPGGGRLKPACGYI